MLLSPDLDADIEMRTSNGKITLHDIEIVATEISKTTLIARIGKGGSKGHGPRDYSHLPVKLKFLPKTPLKLP